MKKLEDYKGKVIKVLTKEHGKKVIKFWKGLGVDTLGYLGCNNKQTGGRFFYYGLDKNGEFDNYSKENVISLGLEIIELPEAKEVEPEYPYQAIVEGKGGKATVWVYGKINNLYITSKQKKESINHDSTLCLYKYTEPIPLKTKLTKQQIADKFGVDVNNIEIVD